MTEEKQKTISVKEFRMWLQGVEEMQPEDWVPNFQQWKRIRDKIDQIGTDEPLPAPPIGQSSPATLPPGTHLVFPPMNTNPPAAPGGHAVPAPSGLNVPSAVPPQQQRPATTQSGLPVTLASGSPKVPVKTPDIDTSSGNYRTSFE